MHDRSQPLNSSDESSRLDWLTEAARLPGKSLHLGVVLYSMMCAEDSYQVALSNVTTSGFGIDRNAKYRALSWLEGAGLIHVDRKLGRPPLITIVIRRNERSRENSS